jgi:HAD superfamily phosphatase (TIGR01668 family)
MPDLYLDDIYCISSELLTSKGIKAVLLDIDNTLVTYDDPLPTESVLNWLTSLSEAGISAAFISNNHRDRVELFNSNLKLFATWDSKKPSGKCYRAAMKHLGTDTSNTAVIGDQVFTDVIAGNRAGVRTFMVEKLHKKEIWYVLLKRPFEKLVRLIGKF